MAEAVPIRPGVGTESDSERELLSVVAEQLSEYRQSFGESAHSIAFVLRGPSGYRTFCADLSPEPLDKVAFCGAASILLAKVGTRTLG